MNQNEIEAFLAIIEFGSIKAASEKLYVGQPTLSARIKSLEEELDTTLFNRQRGHRNTELTIQGKKFEQYARKWIELSENAKEAVRDTGFTTVNIGSCHSVNAYIMPELYRNLSCETRQISLRLWTHHYNEVFKKVESSEIDFGFVSKLQYSKEAKVYELFSEEMVMLVENNNFYPEIVHPKDLDIRKEIYVDWDDNFSKWHKYWLGSPQAALLQTSDVTSVKHFVHTGEESCKNWAIVPMTVAKMICRNTNYSFCFLADKPFLRTTSLICQDEINTYPIMKEMLPIMKKIVERLGAHWIYNEII